MGRCRNEVLMRWCRAFLTGKAFDTFRRNWFTGKSEAVYEDWEPLHVSTREHDRPSDRSGESQQANLTDPVEHLRGRLATMSREEYPEIIEKCHYCGVDLESNALTEHLRNETEILAELPALLGTAMGTGSIDLHAGKLYQMSVRSGECLDEVKTELITKEHARTLLLTEINFHKMTLDGLTARSDEVLAKIEGSAPP